MGATTNSIASKTTVQHTHAMHPTAKRLIIGTFGSSPRIETKTIPGNGPENLNRISRCARGQIGKYHEGRP